MKDKSDDMPEELHSPTEEEFRADLSETLYSSIFWIEGAKDGLQGDASEERISDPRAKEPYEQGRETIVDSPN